MPTGPHRQVHWQLDEEQEEGRHRTRNKGKRVSDLAGIVATAAVAHLRQLLAASRWLPCIVDTRAFDRS